MRILTFNDRLINCRLLLVKKFLQTFSISISSIDFFLKYFELSIGHKKIICDFKLFLSPANSPNEHEIVSKDFNFPTRNHLCMTHQRFFVGMTHDPKNILRVLHFQVDWPHVEYSLSSTWAKSTKSPKRSTTRAVKMLLKRNPSFVSGDWPTQSRSISSPETQNH